MPDQPSLSSAAIREIVGHIDASLVILDRYRGRGTAEQLQMRSMLIALRRQLTEQLGTKERAE